MAEEKKQDRISRFLVETNQGIIFDELSDAYLEKAGAYDILHGVPVPIMVDDEGMSTLTVALGMARVVGGDINFKYADAYIRYIKMVLGDVAVRVLVSEGARSGMAGDYEVACMYFRAALTIDPKSCDALYLYGRACKDAYEIEDKDEDYVGMFKAESLEVFEILTMMHPHFAMGFYFLGYGYLNLGLYTKAELTWEEFISLSEEEENCNTGTSIMKPEDIKDMRTEIQERLVALKEPVVIEKGCNLILSGDYLRGREILEKYTEGRYEKWWPLWYYLGIARSALMDVDGAIAAFKQALVYSPSNVEVMKELVSIYEAVGDETGADKYRKKIEIVSE